MELIKTSSNKASASEGALRDQHDERGEGRDGKEDEKLAEPLG